MQIDLASLAPAEKQQWLQHAIGPRPICFASTINAKGEVNLSPFSFFNMFSANPPIVVFSPSRRVRDNTTKHTLQNVQEVPEVVINIVDYDMAQQMSLASCEYPQGVNEFSKAGFTQEAATIIKPPMVKESKVKMECKVIETKSLGNQGGSGCLVICEVIRLHITDSILNEHGSMIDQRKLELIARLGGNWYSRVNTSNLFEIEKPNTQLGIGVDALPEAIRNSTILTGNNIGQLANVHALPTVDPAFDDARLKEIVQYFSVSPDEMERELHQYAKQLLAQQQTAAAWQVLLAAH